MIILIRSRGYLFLFCFVGGGGRGGGTVITTSGPARKEWAWVGPPRTVDRRVSPAQMLPTVSERSCDESLFSQGFGAALLGPTCNHAAIFYLSFLASTRISPRSSLIIGLPHQVRGVLHHVSSLTRWNGSRGQACPKNDRTNTQT
jgi:hypothetical protein